MSRAIVIRLLDRPLLSIEACACTSVYKCSCGTCVGFLVDLTRGRALPCRFTRVVHDALDGSFR